MNLDLTKRWITRWEGTRAIAYDDATGKPIQPGVKILGNPSIGVGLNLLTAEARAAIVAMELDFQSVISGTAILTPAEIDSLLTGCIRTAVATATVLVPIFNAIPDNQQLVLVDLAFNMGQSKLSEFHQMLGYVKGQNWTAAAAALQDSAWFHQVGPGRNQRGGADVAVLGIMAAPEDILSGKED